MSAENLMAAVVLVALMAYAIFGGADFGGGFWNAFAFGPRRQELREAISRSMGPVWETNHVWLILVLVALWTAFPVVFSTLFENLFLPLSVALLGIVFRGAAFAFQHYGGQQDDGGLPGTGLIFSSASMITPFAMGVAVGAVINGTLTLGEPSGLFDAWLHPFPLLCGFIGVMVCAFLTPFYMLARPLDDLAIDMRRLAFAGSIGLGAVTALALPPSFLTADDFSDRLFEPGPLVVVVAAAVFGTLSLVVLLRQMDRLAPFVAAGTVVLLLAGWGVAQYPYMILPDLTIDEAAAGDPTLKAMLIVLPIGAVVLVPSLLFLFSLFAAVPVEEVDP